IALLEASPAPMSAIETAQLLNVSRITARRYLEFLVSQRKAALELEYQKVGRPTNRYHLVR
ncbi:MAG: response regulator, partial [Pyramidobacter sp.]|nr:response regulator [Pyramidobacter sp.]